MIASPFDNPILSGLLGDAEIADYFSVEADVHAMLAFEAALARAEAAHGVIPLKSARRISEACCAFVPDIASLRTNAGRDGVVIPDLVRQLRKTIGDEAAHHAHFGATSQDVIDTSLMLRLKSVHFLFAGRLDAVIEALEDLDRRFGSRVLIGRTRMQAAIPVTVADRLRAWRTPLEDYRDTLMVQTFPVQFGGAVGTLEKLGDKADVVRATLAQELGLADEPQWQSQRRRIVEIANLLSLITGSLGKMGQDIALLAQVGDEIELAGGGGSSAMAHKQNPIAAETLISLGRFNATLVGGLHQSMIHEQERSGAAWTLEWLLLPQMVMSTAVSLRLAFSLLVNVADMGS